MGRSPLISKIKIKARPGSGTSLLVPELNRFYVASQAIGDQEAAILDTPSIVIFVQTNR